MRVRKDQRGFTIVEVLIASAILSIVVLTVCAFILVGSRSYATANSDINVQQEAQLSLNQMSDVLIDTTRSVNYVGYAGSSMEKALKDAEFTFTPEDKSLIMYNGVLEETPPAVPGGAVNQTVDPGNGNKHYHFYWNKKAETLYYAELDVQPADVDTAAIHFPAFDPDDPVAAGWVVLAERVTNFSADLSQVEEKRVVQLSLTFLDGRKEYTTSNNVTIRNKVGVNDAELDPLNRKKTLSVVARDKGVILEPGESYHFSTPKVTGENVSDRSVTWSLASSGSPSGGTRLTDTVNGILQIATDEPAGTVSLVITTNAVDSDGNHASCIVEVYIKRVTTVSLTKTADSDSDNGPLEISPGCTFTISANVAGTRLGEICYGCGDDTTIDKQVVGEGNPYGNPYVWLIHNPSSVPGATTSWDPTPYIEILESKEDHATFRLKSNAPVSDANTEYGVVIQAMSFLSTQDNAHGRHYDNWVPGAIELKFKQGKETAEPYKGKLKYGEQTLDESVREGLPTDYSKYVTAIRVKDNSGKEPDKILLHYTIGGGNNYRICPDLFDLDLNGSYTFYMQAIFPIAEDRYVPGQGGYPDDNATIREEYFENIKGKTASEGYTGTKYRHGKVFYAKLDRPKLTYMYKGVEYTGKNITYDSINIYTVGVGSGIVGEIRPSKYENIVDDNSVWNHIANSLYEGEGTSQSQWKKLYYVDEDSIEVYKDSGGEEQYKYNYHGKNTLADGAVHIDPRGSMFMKLNSSNNLQKVCGNYHIVPGMVYKNRDPGSYEIIGWEGFDYPNLPRKYRYYEFDDSTIHVKVTDEFTMDINHSDFKGQAMFPLPQAMKGDPLFPNINSLEWQATGGSMTVKACRDGNSWAEDLTFTYVRYRYIKSENAWEVEPVRLEYPSGSGSKKIRVHSYGIYKCGENEKKWTCLRKGSTEEREFTISRFDYNGGSYQAYFPLPEDGNFPFADGTGERTYKLDLYNSNMQPTNNVPSFIVTCKKNGDEYEIVFRTEERANAWDSNNHKINIHYYGTYTWRPGQKEWTRKKGNSTEYKTDYVANLEGLQIGNTSYKMYFPLPTESSFPFKGSGTEISASSFTYYLQDDVYAESAQQIYNTEIRHEVTGGVHQITFFRREWNGEVKYGTYRWDGQSSWTKVN